MAVSSLVVVIGEDEVPGWAGNLGMKAFIFLSGCTKQILLGFSLPLHKSCLAAQLVCLGRGKGAKADVTHRRHTLCF